MPYLTDVGDPKLEGVGSQPAIQDVLSAILGDFKGVSDILFSPGRPPQIESGGQLVPVSIPGLGLLSADDTARIVSSLIGDNAHAKEMLRTEGSCNTSFSLPALSRFRVNIFAQRGSYAVVIRVIPDVIPSFETLDLPTQLGEIASLLNGIVLVTGAACSGKSSTLAALVNRINQEKSCHIITIEDPIEFIHPHKKATIHQRELYTDAPSFALALRAALRQAPKVILVGELRDKETIEAALEAAETGHLVLAVLHTADASKTVERLLGVFPSDERHLIRNRLAKSFRYIISQRLIPSKHGSGRVAAIEILRSTSRTRDCIEKGDKEGNTLLDAMRGSRPEGMQDFDSEIEKLVRSGEVDFETGLAYSTNLGNLKLKLSDVRPRAPLMMED
jgi:twitching motility protein PilT